MIKKTNTRIMITLPKKQVEWIRETASKMHLTSSQLIKFILAKRLNELYEFMGIYMNPEELEERIRIANTPWLDVVDDEEARVILEEYGKSR